jgi:processive 1,2-diacylglycerol beta-glucosyltransferase
MKKVAILTLSIGSGHVRASSAVERALSQGGENIDARVMDAIELSQFWFRGVYVHPYWWMLRRAPRLWQSLFHRRNQKRHRATAPHWVFRHGCVRLLRQLQQFSPHLVIATEIAAAEIAALGKREGWFNAPILAVHTDYHSEPPWAQSEVDFYCVGTEEAKYQLIGWGISPHRILVSGVPIDPAFSMLFDKSEVLSSLGLSPRRPVVLLMGGGMGPMPMDEIVQRLESSGLPLQVVAVCGHNREARARLEKLRSKSALPLQVFGWIENIPELMAAADLLVTKPGGLTAAEALASGLPMLLTSPIPGPEERHVALLARKGLAVVARTRDDVPKVAAQLLSNPQVRANMARHARDAARPDAADAVAQVARALLERATYIDLLSSPPAPSGESAYVM